MFAGRILLASSILVLLFLGAVRPESYPVWRAIVLIPGAFLLVALLLLALPVLAEAERIPWKRMRGFVTHSNILWVAGAVVLVAVASVSVVNHASMTVLERVVFYGAAAIGLGAVALEAVAGLRHGQGTTD